MANSIRNFSFWSLFFLLLGSAELGAQTNVVYGVVLEEKTNMRLPSVAVVNVRSEQGVRTNRSGRFSLTAQPGDTLVFSLPLFSFTFIKLNSQYLTPSILNFYSFSTSLLKPVFVKFQK
jgi:hypothetical protein